MGFGSSKCLAAIPLFSSSTGAASEFNPPQLTAMECITQYGHLMTAYEKTEILSGDHEIYFLGTPAAKEQRKSQVSTVQR